MPVKPLSDDRLELYKTYLMNLKKLSKETSNFYIAEARKVILWATENNIDKIEMSHIEDYDRYIEAKHTHSVYQKKKSAINSFKEFLRQKGLTNVEDADLKIRPYTNNELEFLQTIMMAAGNNVTRYRNLLLIELALHGLSLKEITTITDEQLDFKNNLIKLSDREVMILDVSNIKKYYDLWKDIVYERTKCYPETYIITTLKDLSKPIKNYVLFKWMNLISDLGGIIVSIESLNMTYLKRLIISGISEDQILPQLGSHLRIFLPLHSEVLNSIINEQ
ncbi:hypothetical protein POF51_25840 [Brevibacillus sp. AG]|uniref:hypothetical protein n=1 Tax=Brevibacillus sp. AG TaxID=3020891 RepID=UPI00232EECA1|nr:hypothetical protein [Brevibacillus sp. AG]MDC0764145.1 hypothetical protein [Brevibacillus sp. AG]